MIFQVPMYVSCHFALDTTVYHFQNWLTTSSHDAPCFGFHGPYLYQAFPSPEIEQEGKSGKITFWGDLVRIPEFYEMFGTDEKTAKEFLSKDIPELLPFLLLNQIHMAPTRIEMQVVCSGGVFNNCLRELLKRIDLYWPSIKDNPCEVRYNFPGLAPPVDYIKTIADFLEMPPDIPSVAEEQLMQEQAEAHQADDRPAKPSDEQNESVHLEEEPKGRPPRRPTLFESDPKAYTYRLFLAEKAQELMKDNSGWSWADAARKLQVTGAGRPIRAADTKKLQRDRDSLRTAKPGVLSVLEHYRPEFEEEFRNMQRQNTRQKGRKGQ